MIPRVLAVAAFTAAVCLVPGTSVTPSAAAVVTVEVVDMSFTPSMVKAGLGDTVTWRFQDAMTHTTTSDQGFWDSGSKTAGQSFSHLFVSAGTFPYHCSFHSMMRGAVKVGIKATGSPTSGWRVRWATVQGSGPTTYDVQVRKPGSNRWTTLKDDVTKPSMRYNPAKSGKYAVRARTNSGRVSSGWSPSKSLTIS